MAEFTGRRFLAIMVAAFGLVIAVNVLLAYKAVSTFPGLEVANSYVASQTFNADRDAQVALGWKLTTAYDSAARELRVSITDADDLPADVRELQVLVGRTTEAREDQSPEFSREGGVFSAPLDLRPGKWLLRVDAIAGNGAAFRQRIHLNVQG